MNDVPELARFEGRLDRAEGSGDGSGDLAGYLEYHRFDGVWALNHVFTFPAYRGRGVAAELTKAALAAAREAAVQVRPICPFVADYLDTHPEYADLVVPEKSGSDESAM
ncbi:MAG: N-acetyltransferase [Hamadaea sp.]|uniref:GNAT family N-acetyltransferase n=1 Tax=Hamadaea sp. TaxID=2024425 RepID=UPI001816019E|nr:GNAT family N-acetyltransferase [Hamadaea sp.]NUR72930.1 N-acetyltransferase [Hamadaea sp.]NUT23411.1 N-acetyltransferase [Hamadaea sp.]